MKCSSSSSKKVHRKWRQSFYNILFVKKMPWVEGGVDRNKEGGPQLWPVAPWLVLQYLLLHHVIIL